MSLLQSVRFSLKYSPVEGWANHPSFWCRYHSPSLWKPTKNMIGMKLFNWTLFIRWGRKEYGYKH